MRKKKEIREFQSPIAKVKLTVNGFRLIVSHYFADKKLSTYSANFSSSSSNASSSSRTSSGAYAKVPLPSSPRLHSFAQETSKSNSAHAVGEKIRDERRPPGPPPPPPSRKPTSLDMKLATLRKEMVVGVECIKITDRNVTKANFFSLVFNSMICDKWI